MNAFRPSSVQNDAPLRWVVAAPGEEPVNWEQIVSEDEDGVLSGWAREVSVTSSNVSPRRCA